MIDAKVKVCTRCTELCANRTQTVFGEGTPDADVVFVGEGPGKDEDKSGRPFVGAAGQFLDKIIKACGWTREQVYILNVVKCRPPQNRTPTFEEAENCSRFLKLQLKTIRPKIIVCLGAAACHQVLGSNGSMASYRGEWFGYKDGEFEAKVRCTYHPSYILHITDAARKKEEKDKIWNDMQAVIKELQ